MSWYGTEVCREARPDDMLTNKIKPFKKPIEIGRNLARSCYWVRLINMTAWKIRTSQDARSHFKNELKSGKELQVSLVNKNLNKNSKGRSMQKFENTNVAKDCKRARLIINKAKVLKWSKCLILKRKRLPSLSDRTKLILERTRTLQRSQYRQLSRCHYVMIRRGQIKGLAETQESRFLNSKEAYC